MAKKRRPRARLISKREEPYGTSFIFKGFPSKSTQRKYGIVFSYGLGASAKGDTAWWRQNK